MGAYQISVTVELQADTDTDALFHEQIAEQRLQEWFPGAVVSVSTFKSVPVKVRA